MYICSSSGTPFVHCRATPARSHPNSPDIIDSDLGQRYTHENKNIHIQNNKMPPCIEKARAIMRVLTEDMWNHKAKHERTRLWRMYCSPQIKAYTPDGGESTGYEEVRLVPAAFAGTGFC